MKTKDMKTPHSRKSIGRSPLRLGFLLLPLALACFALSPTARAADGGLPSGNTAEGTHALFNNTGGNNTANGFKALVSNTTGGNNTASGFEALFSNTTADNNTAHGGGALFSNTTGTENTATGLGALYNNTTGNNNTANGFFALVSNIDGGDNTANGHGALASNTNGSNNTANGFRALINNTIGSNNTAHGESALLSNTMGGSNTAIGDEALFSNTSGSNNIALGIDAGSTLTMGDFNIDIGNAGMAGEGATIRIGSANQTKTFIAGISGTAAGTDAVFVNSLGQLGVGVPSSARFKTEIKPMDKASEAILALKPVTFRYKQELDPKTTLRFGLVAEEVAKVNPDLVGRDAKGQVHTVHYEAVNAMLLNEFLKEHHKVEEQNRRIQRQETTITQLKKEMGSVVARLKEQDSKIEKVSAQLEVSKPAPQTVLNNQ